MAASNYYSPQPDATVNTGVDPVTDTPMMVGNPALSRRSQKKSNKNALMIGIPVAAVLIAGLGAAVMMGDKGSSVGEATTTQTSQTTSTASTAPAAVPTPLAAVPEAPVPVHAAANTMDATPPVTQSAEPTPIRHAPVRHVASRSSRSAAPSAADNSADVSATVPVNPPATTPSASAMTPPPVISAPPPAATPQPQAGQPVNPAPDSTTTQP